MFQNMDWNIMKISATKKLKLCSRIMFRTHVLEHGRTYVLKNHVPEHELEHYVPNMTEHMFQKIMFQNMIWNMEHVHVPVLFLFPVNPEHEQHCNIC